MTTTAKEVFPATFVAGRMRVFKICMHYVYKTPSLFLIIST